MSSIYIKRYATFNYKFIGFNGIIKKERKWCDVAIIGCTTSRMLIHKLQYRNLLVHGINIHYPQHSHSHTCSVTFTHMLNYIHTHTHSLFTKLVSPIDVIISVSITINPHLFNYSIITLSN
jgi:hypothetical protein